MNKKQLSSLLDQLAARLEQASSDNKSLNLENKALQERCEKLTEEAKELEAKLAGLQAEVEALRARRDTISTQETENSLVPENAPALSPIENLTQKVTEKPLLSQETEYAASVIGKIVVSATEHCNYLTTNANNANAKELINLILGKTEVLKAEILNIVYSPADFITKKALIDNQFDTARDYFASVKAQI